MVIYRDFCLPSLESTVWLSHAHLIFTTNIWGINVTPVLIVQMGEENMLKLGTIFPSHKSVFLTFVLWGWHEFLSGWLVSLALTFTIYATYLYEFKSLQVFFKSVLHFLKDFTYLKGRFRERERENFPTAGSSSKILWRDTAGGTVPCSPRSPEWWDGAQPLVSLSTAF